MTTYYGYDQSGHVTGISPNATNTCPTDSSSTCLSYDAQGRLIAVTKASGLSVSMTYNAQGQRMTYAASGAGTNLSETFQYRGGELAQVTTTGSQSTTDTYVYRRDGTPLELIRTQSGVTSEYWYEVDGRGDVIALTDAAGNTVDRYSYDLWGKVVSSSESVPQRLRYTGAWYDQELGWYWMSTRAYDPVLERFLQPDPSELEGLFSYIYAGDNPSDLGDASGLLPTPPQTGCLLPGSPRFTPYECDVAVGSAQWNYEVSHGGCPIAGAACAQGGRYSLVTDPRPEAEQG